MSESGSCAGDEFEHGIRKLPTAPRSAELYPGTRRATKCNRVFALRADQRDYDERLALLTMERAATASPS